MKLKAFEAPRSSGTPYIRLNTNGCSSISHEAIAKLDLTLGDHINFFQDEKDINNWYVATVNENGFTTRKSSSEGARVLLFNASKFGKTIAKQFDVTTASIRLQIGDKVELNGCKYWSLITAALKN